MCLNVVETAGGQLWRQCSEGRSRSQVALTPMFKLKSLYKPYIEIASMIPTVARKPKLFCLDSTLSDRSNASCIIKRESNDTMFFRVYFMQFNATFSRNSGTTMYEQIRNYRLDRFGFVEVLLWKIYKRKRHRFST